MRIECVEARVLGMNIGDVFYYQMSVAASKDCTLVNWLRRTIHSALFDDGTV